MDLTSFLWNAAGNPLWSSVYCTYRGIELASRFTTATLASKLVVIPQVSVWSSSGDLQSFSKALCSPVVAEVLKVQALCSPLAEVEKPELFAVHVTGLKFENALERNDVKEITEFCDFMDGPSSRVWNVASPLHVTEENPSRSLLYGDEGIGCVTTLMSSVVTSTRYDWQSIPQYGEFFVCRLNLISATSVAYNSSGSEIVYGLRPTDHRNFFP
jgi:hypothetical protein